MDLITQGIAGSLLAQSCANKAQKTSASLVGFLAGLLPDADILIRSSTDPLLNLEFHRQFSHALIFIPLGGLIASILLWPFFRKHLPFFALYLFCVLGYSTGGLLDACTSFGTQLLWPFSDQRIAWNLISIIDPIFSLVLLSFLLMGWKKKSTQLAIMGLIFACAYLLFSSYQQYSISKVQYTLAQSRGHQIEKSIIKPTLGNIILWRSVYLFNQQYYVDGIRLTPFGTANIYAGSAIQKYPLSKLPPQNIQQQDIQRFNTLSQGFLVRHPNHQDVIGDIRYAMLPNSTEPLWGIRIDPNQPDKHVSEQLFRKKDNLTRQLFIRMLLGKHLSHP